MDDRDYKGFLLIKQTYKVRCRSCGFRGNATLGDEPIQGADTECFDWCPVCNAAALGADNEKVKGRK